MIALVNLCTYLMTDAFNIYIYRVLRSSYQELRLAEGG